MELEFIGRWPKQKTLSKEQRKINSILGQEDDTEDVEYILKPLVFDISDPMTYNMYDEEHTVVRTIRGEVFIVKCRFEVFKALREHFTGYVVRKVEDFMFEESAPERIEKLLKHIKEERGASGPESDFNFD